MYKKSLALKFDLLKLLERETAEYFFWTHLLDLLDKSNHQLCNIFN